MRYLLKLQWLQKILPDLGRSPQSALYHLYQRFLESCESRIAATSSGEITYTLLVTEGRSEFVDYLTNSRAGRTQTRVRLPATLS